MKRLGDAEGDELDVVRERRLQPVDQALVERERDDEGRRDRAQRDEEARAELVEVLDERGLLAVAEAPRQPLQATAPS